MADEPNSPTPPASAPADPPASGTPPASSPAGAAGAGEPATLLGNPADPADPAAAPKEPEAPKQPAGAPEKYELKAPEGVEVDTEALTSFETVARDLNLTNEAAQKLMDFEAARLKPLFEAPFRAWAEQNARWQSEVKADPEIGGAKMDASISEASRALDGFADIAKAVGVTVDGKALRDALSQTGAGNHPAIVKAFVAIGKLMAEDRGIAPVARPPAQRAQSIEEIGQRLYPTMNNGA
ncbi:MAG: peptidase [Patescibacteria group bacterium]|nr:peptidase [Patescibacteria group bacterium]